MCESAPEVSLLGVCWLVSNFCICSQWSNKVDNIVDDLERQEWLEVLGRHSVSKIAMKTG
jgi:hypothetical protein